MTVEIEENDDLEWEEWNPAKLTFIHHMIAGSSAGLAEHVSMVRLLIHPIAVTINLTILFVFLCFLYEVSY